MKHNDDRIRQTIEKDYPDQLEAVARQGIRKGVLALEITAEGTLSSCRYSGQQDYDFFQELRMGNDSGLVIFSALFALVAIVVLPFLTAAR
jgi:hypothetical protein